MGISPSRAWPGGVVQNENLRAPNPTCDVRNRACGRPPCAEIRKGEGGPEY